MATSRLGTPFSILMILMTSVEAAVILTPNDNTGSDGTTGTGSDATTGNKGGGNSSFNGNVEVIFAAPGTTGNTGEATERGNGDNGMNTANMKVMVGEMTVDDWMAFVCDRLPPAIPECSGVQDLRSYLTIHRDRLLGILSFAKKRKRRAFTDPFWTDPWQGLDFPPLSFDPWQPLPNPGLPPVTPQPGAPLSPGGLQGDPFDPFSAGGAGFRPAVVCPTPVDQTFVYRPVADAAGYPAGAIGQEIANPVNLPLRDCLSREVLATINAPVPVSEPFRDTVSPTCPYTQLRLWRYQSLSQGAECWVLQNFGDNILYRTCDNKFCSNCQDSQSSLYSWSGFNSQAGVTGSLQKLCLPDYRTVTFWAYCPGNVPGLRLVRDNIVIPVTCNCQGVRCQPLPHTNFQG